MQRACARGRFPAPRGYSQWFPRTGPTAAFEVGQPFKRPPTAKVDDIVDSELQQQAAHRPSSRGPTRVTFSTCPSLAARAGGEHILRALGLGLPRPLLFPVRGRPQAGNDSCRGHCATRLKSAQCGRPPLMTSPGVIGMISGNWRARAFRGKPFSSWRSPVARAGAREKTSFVPLSRGRGGDSFALGRRRFLISATGITFPTSAVLLGESGF